MHTEKNQEGARWTAGEELQETRQTEMEGNKLTPFLVFTLFAWPVGCLGN